MNSIYEQMNNIDDNESLNEKYNVRTIEDVKKLQESSNKYTSKRVVKKKKITESLSTEAEWEELDSAETMDDERSWQPLRLWKNKTENKYVIIIGDNYPWEGYVNMEFDNEAEAEHEFAAYLNEPYYNTDYEDDYDDDIDEKYDVIEDVKKLSESGTSPNKRKLSKNDIIYRYNFGLPMSEEDILKIGTVEQHKENAERIHAAVLAIKKWDPSISVSRKKDWTSMLLFLRRGAKDELTEEERNELKTVISNVTNFKNIRVYGGDNYLRCNGFVDISPEVTEFINH